MIPGRGGRGEKRWSASIHELASTSLPASLQASAGTWRCSATGVVGPRQRCAGRRSTTVRATIVGAAPAPGSSVRVFVPTGPAVTAVVIPVSALRRGPSGDHVFVVAPDQSGKIRAHERPVRSGALLGDEIVILEGLTAGEQVAASGSFKLREAVQVVVPAPKGAQ